MENRFEIEYSQNLLVDSEQSCISILRDKTNGVEYLYIRNSRSRLGDYSISITPLLDADGMPSVKY